MSSIYFRHFDGLHMSCSSLNPFENIFLLKCNFQCDNRYIEWKPEPTNHQHDRQNAHNISPLFIKRVNIVSGFMAIHKACKYWVQLWCCCMHFLNILLLSVPTAAQYAIFSLFFDFIFRCVFFFFYDFS